REFPEVLRRLARQSPAGLAGARASNRPRFRFAGRHHDRRRGHDRAAQIARRSAVGFERDGLMSDTSFIRSEVRNHPRHNWSSLSFIGKAYYALRSVVVWLASFAFFFPVCPLLVLLGAFVDPRKNDRPQRWLFRNILRVAGVDFEARYSPGFDRDKVSFFVCNHVDLWDAFIIYS